MERGTNENITQSFSSIDNETGIAKYQYSHDGINVVNDISSTWLINFDGQWNFFVRAVDNAGNAGPWSDMYTLRRDTTGPTITNYWYGLVNVDTVSLYIQVVDEGCGINRVQCPTSTEIGGYTDWIWLNTIWDSGANAYRADINAKDYNKFNTYYLTHIYVYDNLQNMNMIGLNGQEKYLSIINQVESSITNGITYTSNTIIHDGYNNSIKIPAGFKIASDSGKNVTEGIVIEDVTAGNNTTKGNQYVWVPIGNIKTNTNGTIVTINLGRYDFESNYSGIMVQPANEYNNVVTINGLYQELVSGGKNVSAKNLGDFCIKS